MIAAGRSIAAGGPRSSAWRERPLAAPRFGRYFRGMIGYSRKRSIMPSTENLSARGGADPGRRRTCREDRGSRASDGGGEDKGGRDDALPAPSADAGQRGG